MQHNHIFVEKNFAYSMSHKPKKIFTSERDQKKRKKMNLTERTSNIS